MEKKFHKVGQLLPKIQNRTFGEMYLTQLISEPTNFTPNKNPTCIDLLITDQPNLVLDSGTRPSLDSKCHHQIVYGKINYNPNWQVKTFQEIFPEYHV